MIAQKPKTLNFIEAASAPVSSVPDPSWPFRRATARLDVINTPGGAASFRSRSRSMLAENSRQKRFAETRYTMKLGKTACVFATTAIVALGGVGWMLTSHRPHLVTASFDPAYPETNGSGDPILAVLEGIIPCT